MSQVDKIDITESQGEVTITIDTTGTGRAIADALIHHVDSILGNNQ